MSFPTNTGTYKSKQVRALDTPSCPENAACDFTSSDEDIMKAHIQSHKSQPFVCEYGCTQRAANSDESVQRTFKDAHEVYMHISKYHSQLIPRPFYAKQPGAEES